MFNRITRKTGVPIALLLPLLMLAFSTLFATPVAAAAPTISVNGASRLQTMDGFGFSNAFGPAATLETSPASQQSQVLDLLFSPSKGAGFTILRNLFPSDAANTIEPTSPGKPGSTPKYVALGSSEGQV
jgi:glucuronoarabinoxylan endo-1,4-beta-xylanase